MTSGENRVRVTSPFPIVISGPSGAGKTTVVDEVLRRDPLLKRSISATTRPPRGDEEDGEDYYFVPEAEFEQLKKGNLIEWARVHDHFYGTPRDRVEDELAAGFDVVLNIDVQGGNEVKKAFPGTALIFMLTPSRKVLEDRIRKRNTELSGTIEKRLANALQEIKWATGYDYIVENDRLDATVITVLSIIRSERHRRTRYPSDYIERFRTK